MLISRWEPFRGLATMQHGLNHIFNGGFSHGWEPPFRGEGAGERVWKPAMDILETDRDLVFKVELAGVDPNDVEVRVEDNTLYLNGNRKLEKDAKDQKYYHVERFFGSFARSFTLPHSVDSEKVAAEYRDGVLTLTLPKKEAAKPKTIKISVSGS
jgi:HSP20 family protein